MGREKKGLVDLEIVEITPRELTRYAKIPISFTVDSILAVEAVEGGLEGLRLCERPILMPYIKDYDGDGPELRPVRWARRWDVSNWAFLMACEGGEDLGGATVAYDTPGVDMLDGRRDMAVLWDLRVRPDRRDEGIGRRLFWRAAEWARSRPCDWLKIETQNINVRACRFYAKQGCELGTIDRYGYAGDPRVAHEVRLFWYLRL
jgi:GNAT superfamily N-acetyltransferase